MHFFAEPICKNKQDRYDAKLKNDTSRQEFLNRCHIREAQAKAKNDSLELSDVLIEDCHRPRCKSNNNFASQQCYKYARSWCWCSTAEGYSIEGTLQNNMPEGFCSKCMQCLSITEHLK